MAEVFTMGQQASASAFLTALQNIQSQGSTILASLQEAQSDTILEFERRLSAINARRTRSYRVSSPEKPVKFVVTDFLDVDQGNTTGTLRADSGAFTLRERAQLAEAQMLTVLFSSNVGTVENINPGQYIYTVHVDDGSGDIPTGEFDITLQQALTLSQLIIDIPATPSQPTINISVSTDNIIYSAATQIALTGYRITAWLPAVLTKYVKVIITPSHPDDLSGTSFTFGVVDFSANSTEYQLRSSFITQPILFTPNSTSLVFDAQTDPNILYYLSIGAPNTSIPFVAVNPGEVIPIPGTTQVTATGIAMDNTGLLAYTMPTNAYLTTLTATDGTSVVIRTAPYLSQTDANLTKLTNEYIAIQSNQSIRLLRADGVYNNTRTFNLSFVTGPSQVQVQLNATLSTTSNTVSPTFVGASLDEA